jgi:hypothetical protein
MSIFVVLCFGAAVLLAAIAAAYHPPAPPRYNLLAGAVAFLALGFLLQSLAGVPG